jgi:hypothetical protein
MPLKRVKLKHIFPKKLFFFKESPTLCLTKICVVPCETILCYAIGPFESNFKQRSV